MNYAANDNRVASYKYDWLGRRVIKLVYDNGQLDKTVKYCYDRDQVIAEYDGSDTQLRRFVYGAGIDEPLVYYDIHFTRYYYHYDGLGSVA